MTETASSTEALRTLLGITTTEPEEPVPIAEYLRDWKNYGLNAAGRIKRAFGEPKVVDTSQDERLGRIFSNRTIRLYPAFRDFYGIEETIETIAHHFQSAADGLVGARQIQLYIGPPGSGKSSFATRMRDLAEQEPMWVLAHVEGTTVEVSPVFESPLGLFQTTAHQAKLTDAFGIPPGRFGAPMSPWAAAKLDAYKGDLTRFHVVRIKPSQARSIGIAKVAPGNSRAGDVSAFIGIGSDTPTLDGYAYIGGLNRTTQGLLEIVEMFGAKLTNLEPLIGATQDSSYASAGLGEFPYQGVVIAHANEGPWREFKEKSKDSPLISRIREIPFPLCVRAQEIGMIHAKYLAASEFAKAPRTPGALDYMAIATALTRVHEGTMTRVLAYDGRTPPSNKEKEWDVAALRARAREEARKHKRPGEGMAGLPERDSFALLDRAVVCDPTEPGLDEAQIYETLFSAEAETGIPTLDGKDTFAKSLQDELLPLLVENVRTIIRQAYIERHADVAHERANWYYTLADALAEGSDLKDPATGEVRNLVWIREQIARIEGPYIRVPNDFRARMIRAVLHHRAKHGVTAPVWDALNEELRNPFERMAASDTSPKGEDDLPAIISFDRKQSKELEQKHEAFVARMCAAGYTLRQVRRFVDFYLRHVPRPDPMNSRR